MWGKLFPGASVLWFNAFVAQDFPRRAAFMATSPKVVTLIVVLSLLAVVAVGAWVHFATAEPPRLRDLTAVPAEPAGLMAAYQAETLGAAGEGVPAITHVTIADLDADGLQDVIVSDAGSNRVTWVRQSPQGVWTERPLGERIPAPGRLALADLNQDGRMDVAVASLGRVLPNGDRIGRVVILENGSDNAFRTHVVAENLARVADLRASDLNGDGRPDLVLGEWEPDKSGLAWMENLGEGRFQRHALAGPAGVVAIAAADFDGDKKPDLATLSVREQTEVRVLTNAGDGTFREGVVWTSTSAVAPGGALDVCDLNRDQRPDLIWSDGGNLHSGFPEPMPAHGVQWLENRAGGFVHHRIGALPGAFGPAAVDLDADGDTDVVAVSPLNRAADADAVWLMAWINDGRQGFTPEPLARDPIRLQALAAGDLDGNGTPVLVTGALHVLPPVAHASRLTLWRHH